MKLLKILTQLPNSSGFAFVWCGIIQFHKCAFANLSDSMYRIRQKILETTAKTIRPEPPLGRPQSGGSFALHVNDEVEGHVTDLASAWSLSPPRASANTPSDMGT